MKFTLSERVVIMEKSKGKVIESMSYDESEEYWTMTFTDGSEMSFKFMAEMI